MITDINCKYMFVQESVGELKRGTYVEVVDPSEELKVSLQIDKKINGDAIFVRVVGGSTITVLPSRRLVLKEEHPDNPKLTKPPTICDIEINLCTLSFIKTVVSKENWPICKLYLFVKRADLNQRDLSDVIHDLTEKVLDMLSKGEILGDVEFMKTSIKEKVVEEFVYKIRAEHNLKEDTGKVK